MNKDMTKIIAYYLPQFHEIPENNEWWGKGFTEWTNVKKAKSFLKDQVQPNEPLNDNYYDLMDKSTVEWQTSLANKYGIYGFCYFHYYFGKKRKLLEKPAENLLRWKDIPQRFCFFWANVSWGSGTWTGVKKGSATTWDSNDEQKKPRLLMEQIYGDETEWREHFEYLLPFFRDERYIKVEGKPFFAIYSMKDIPQYEKMMAFWNELAVKNGLEGIYFASVNNSNVNADANLQYGYGTYKNTLRYKAERAIQKARQIVIGEEKVPNVWEYRSIWKMIVENKPSGKLHNIPGGIVKYDDTPRRGKKALVFRHSSPEIFEKYLGKQIKRAKEIYKSDYLFLCAWNEWGEGNYLEPDKQYGYGYLEAIKNVLEAKE